MNAAHVSERLAAPGKVVSQAVSSPPPVVQLARIEFTLAGMAARGCTFNAGPLC